MPTVSRFEDLEVWKDAQLLAVEVYRLAGQGKFSEDFTAQDQIRKSVLSISSYIAEGFTYGNQMEFAKHLQHARVACAQLGNQAHLNQRIGYLDEAQLEGLLSQIEGLSKKLAGTIEYLRQAN
jgi:four helix bundle protein